MYKYILAHSVFPYQIIKEGKKKMNMTEKTMLNKKTAHRCLFSSLLFLFTFYTHIIGEISAHRFHTFREMCADCAESKTSLS